jgi:hypothetical protein
MYKQCTSEYWSSGELAKCFSPRFLLPRVTRVIVLLPLPLPSPPTSHVVTDEGDSKDLITPTCAQDFGP